MHLLEQLQDKKIALRGYGKEGKASYNFLIKKNIKPKNITIIDSNPNTKTPIKSPNILGNTQINRNNFDYILKSAGISLYKNNLEQLANKTITATQIFFEYFKGKVIAITGTKGKTTITTLAYNLLKNAGYKVQIAGNIGLPILAQIDPTRQEYDYLVVELSSYMLDQTQPHTFISICNDLYHEHHIDRHGSIENYFGTKSYILVNAQHRIVSQQAISALKKHDLRNTERETKLTTFGSNENSNFYQNQDGFFYNDQNVLSHKNIKVPGKHNLTNMCSIIAIGHIMNIDPKIIEKTLNEFRGIEHRLEYVGTHGGILRYNDAIATTPESTIAAIHSFPGQIDTIFLGGKDGNYNFEELTKTIKKENIQNIILFPDSGRKIFKSFTKNKHTSSNIYQTSNMKDAVDFAYKNTKPGKIALLSCASPSYSLRKNFEEKGKLFKKYILEIANKAG